VGVGDVVYLQFSLFGLSQALVTKYNAWATATGRPAVEASVRTTRMPCKVKAIISETFGKIPSAAQGKVLFMEYAQFLTLAAQYLPAQLHSND